MDPVRRHYEAYPYPARDPGEEAKRLITGSPSDPQEIDHFLHRGARDWRKPFRALVAGGGTGDAAIMLGQRLADAGCPAEILYLDMSRASRKIAEARAAARGLGNIRFETGDLLTAPDHGPFDYIDCCGVLHHLPDPQAGFDALAAALAPQGGLGAMVYAPYGRTGVYPLQDALRQLCGQDAPEHQVGVARAVLAALPQTNWFGRNPLLGDHRDSDAGLYDLLLHSRDRPYAVGDLRAALEAAGLRLVSFAAPAAYDPAALLPAGELRGRAAALGFWDRAALAERLSGAMKTHVFYAVRADHAAETVAGPASAAAVPRLTRIGAAQLAAAVAKTGGFRIETGGAAHRVAIPKPAAPIVAKLGSGRSLGEIAAALGLDWVAFGRAYAPVHDALTGPGLLRYSRTFA